MENMGAEQSNLSKRQSSKRFETQEMQMNELESFVGNMKLTFDVSYMGESISKYVKERLQKFTGFVSSKVERAGHSMVETDFEDIEGILEQAREEIKEHAEEVQMEIEEKIEERSGFITDPKLKSIMEQIKELLKDYNTVQVSRKQWQDFGDLSVIHESTGLYVITSFPGYFPDNTVPARQMLKVIATLVDAIVEQEKRLEHLEQANEQFEAAWWAGVDPNTEKLHKDFLRLRRDKQAYTQQSYNDRLGEIALQAELLHDSLSKKDSIQRNIFSAMKYIVIVCSVPELKPLETTIEEQQLCLQKIRAALYYAVGKQKRL